MREGTERIQIWSKKIISSKALKRNWEELIWVGGICISHCENTRDTT